MRRAVRCPRCGYCGTVTTNALTPQQKFRLILFGIALMFLFCVIGVITA